MNLSATSFDLGNAQACAAASARAYREATVSCPSTDTHALIVEQPDCVIIAFRGSSSIRNWITDAEFERNLWKHQLAAEVHDGFLLAFDSIIDLLCVQLKTIGLAGRPLFFTGHSLGGALAVLAALDFKDLFKIHSVITFGQPRVGDSAFKQLYDAALGDRTYRLVYKEDIVPRVPHLPAWHDPYRHVGTEVFISSVQDGTLWFDPPSWRLLMSDIWGIYRAWCVSKFAGALDPFMDHRVENYVNALVNLKP
jgi:triacylglycerol lipase